MPYPTRALLVTLALAPAIAPADIIDVEWSVSNPVLTPENPTTTVRMTATWDQFFAVSFVQSNFRILGDNTFGGALHGASDTGTFILYHNMMEAHVETDAPNDNNDLLHGMAFCNYAFGGSAPSPMEWWFEFTATDFTSRTAGYTAEFESFLMLQNWWGDVIPGEPIVTPVTFRIVPTPATAWVLTTPLVPLICLRRRREPS